MNFLPLLLLAVQAPVLQHDGLQFKDLNKNGVLDPYEDWRLPPEQRARDLAGRMTLEEKAGTMMHGTVRSAGPNGGVGMGAPYDTVANRRLIDSVKVTSLITRLSGDPAAIATQNNALQPPHHQHRPAQPFPVRRRRKRACEPLLPVA